MNQINRLGMGTGTATEQAAATSFGSAAVAAINSDSNYCSSVQQGGSPVNSAVHAFKVAFNAYSVDKLADNGNYDQATAAALISLGIEAPDPCPAISGGGGGGGTAIQPGNTTITTTTTTGLPKWLKWTLGLLAAGGIGYFAWALWQRHEGKSMQMGASEPRRRPRRNGARKGRKKSSRK